MVLRTTPSSGFPYPRIDDKSIRLFKVRKNEDGSISGEMEAFRLRGEGTPAFIAISYYCGPQDRKPEITLNGQPIPVLRSVMPILQMICNNRSFKRDQWWWLDSISIDESNKKEHSAQVDIMDRIYRASEKTLIWLGEESTDSDDAIDFLHLLRSERKAIEDVEAKKSEYHAREFKPRWLAVQNLFLRPWWRRVWTLQELIVPKRAVFYCGAATIDRDKFQGAVLAIYHCRHVGSLMCKDAWDAAWNRRRFVQWYQEKKALPLVALMAYMGQLESGDDRDRIYSLLGLVSAEERAMVDKPDYEHDVEEVYARLVEKHVQLHQSLDIICLTHLFNKHALAEGQNGTLPSWVPDWRAPVVAMVVPLLVSQSARNHIGNCRPLRFQEINAAYEASGYSTPNVEFQQGVLKCEGIFLDTVDGLGASISRGQKPLVESKNSQSGAEDEGGYVPSTSPQNQGGSEDHSNQGIATIGAVELLETVSRALTLDREDKYLCRRAEPHGRIDLRTLCNAVATSSTEFSIDPLFSRWFEGSKMLRMRGLSLGDIFASQDSKIPIASPHPWTEVHDPSEFQTRFLHPTVYMQRRLMVTSHGHVGMGPHCARKGDVVAVLKGCSVPVLLRRVDDGEESGDAVQYENSETSDISESKSLYELIGECYVHGFMEGELLDDVNSDGWRRRRQWFNIA